MINKKLIKFVNQYNRKEQIIYPLSRLVSCSVSGDNKLIITMDEGNYTKVYVHQIIRPDFSVKIFAQKLYRNADEVYEIPYINEYCE